MDILHTAIWVSDLDEAQSFFLDRFGLEVSRRFSWDGVENVFVSGESASIQLKFDAEKVVSEADRATLDHVAILVEDVSDKVSKLKTDTRYGVVSEPQTVSANGERVKIAFIKGTDGYVFELVEEL